MVSATHIKNLCEALLTFEFKRLCLFGAIFGECGECGYYRDFGEKPHYPLCPHSPLYKPPCEAHLTFEAKLRNASTLLRFGRTSKLALLSP